MQPAGVVPHVAVHQARLAPQQAAHMRVSSQACELLRRRLGAPFVGDRDLASTDGGLYQQQVAAERSRD